MLNNRENFRKIIVSGTLAYDRIMDFPGKFRDHILPEKIHILNVSFVINGLKESFGGTAGNISYNLVLLGERPTILGLAGEDFTEYADWLRKQKVDISRIKRVKKEKTACAYIMTDQDDNQIAGFYNGSLDFKYCQIVKKIKNIKMAIIAPEVKERMIEYAKLYKKLKVPYIFDPGQQIINFSSRELKQAINGAKVLIGNDYEIQLIINKLGLGQKDLGKLVETLIITHGAKGSEIWVKGKRIKIPAAKPKNTCDPTGAGDAYRAGLIKGMIEGWSWEKIGRLAGLVSVYTVEKYGTQTHRFNLGGLKNRYYANYKQNLF